MIQFAIQCSKEFIKQGSQACRMYEECVVRIFSEVHELSAYIRVTR